MNKNEIQNLIKDLIDKTGVTAKQITITEENGARTWFSVEVNEPYFFIGHDGEALYALNHLIRRIVESKKGHMSDLWDSHKSEMWPEILIDINDFQKKRIENIRTVAHMMSERARYFKSNIEVDPMSAFERRIVHEFLSNAVDLKTESVGFGPSRRVVIKYVGGI